jgi:hypothetical protein
MKGGKNNEQEEKEKPLKRRPILKSGSENGK